MMMNTHLIFPAAMRLPIIQSSSRSAVHLAGLGRGAGRSKTKEQNRDPHVEDIIKRLQKLSSGPLCDADKGHRGDDPDAQKYEGLNLMNTDVMKLRHAPTNSGVMVGVTKTLQLQRPNDFLSVLCALVELSAGDVLVVNTGGSTRAVAGSLFTTEATRRGVIGIVVDGPIRDVSELDCFSFSTKVTPYAGTVQHVGEGVDASSVQCAGVTVNPGDIIFGDADGVLVGSVDTFSTCLHDAEHIVAAETRLIEGMKVGVSLHSMTNFDEHVAARKEGRESSLTVCVGSLSLSLFSLLFELLLAQHYTLSLFSSKIYALSNLQELISSKSRKCGIISTSISSPATNIRVTLSFFCIGWKGQLVFVACLRRNAFAGSSFG